MKLKWEVAAAPTGPFRSFEVRGWPMGYVDDKPAAAVYSPSGESYRPSAVKAGSHAPLRVSIADYRLAYNLDGRGFTWRTLKGEYATLSEAKKAAYSFLLRCPELLQKNA